MLKKILLVCLLSSPLLLFGQYFEAGLMAGVSNYQGDLGPSNLRVSLGKTHASVGGFLRYNFNDYLTGRVNLAYATLSGDDARYDRGRNLSFRSSILEFAAIGEFNIMGYQPYALQRPFSPYIFVGIGFTHFNPRTKLDGEWIELQPLGTEGQGIEGYPSPYSLFTLAIPVGGGLKYAINDKWNIGIEMGVRKVFTDYLDDVSTSYVDPDLLLANNGELSAILSNRSGVEVNPGDARGNPDSDDWYVITAITVSYNFIDNGLVGVRSRSRRRGGCPGAF